jgi:hypothetical protein
VVGGREIKFKLSQSGSIKESDNFVYLLVLFLRTSTLFWGADKASYNFTTVFESFLKTKSAF